MAFSVVSIMDGSIFGSLSSSNCRSPGSNRAGERKRQVKQASVLSVFSQSKGSVFALFEPTAEVQHRGESRLPSSHYNF